MRIAPVILAAAALLSGCASHNLQRYSQIDEAQKTVTVPPGSKGLKGELKKALIDRGWRLSVDRGPDVTEEEIGEKTRVKSYDTFNTRYRLHVVSSQYDICLNLQPAITYDVSFVDNITGEEVFTLEGEGCEGGAVNKFIEALSGV
jgi:hypothetical protein